MVSVVRAHIVPQTVRYEPAGNVAVIRVSGFNQSTARSLREKIVLARHELGEDMAGLVLDLRGNPGGLLDQAVAVADLLVSRGRIVSTHGRHPDSHQYFDSEPDDLVPDVPVAVLVNGSSASASEIVAAALQDAGRGLVIGTTSFGKGTVQTVLRLPNEGELTLTWARFHAPSGYGLSGRGVLPDVCTNIDATSADDVLKQIRIGVLPFDSATRRADVGPRDEPGLAAFRARCPARQDDSEIDVEVATRLFESPELLARVMGRQGSETALLDGQAPAVAHSDR
jgi:carboxyl-terminal processing protease